MINFTFVGKLSAIKPNDKMTPYDEHKYPSGWMSRKLLFNGHSGSNRYMFNISGGYFPDITDWSIKILGISTKNDDGTNNKGGMIEIPWKDRNLESNIEKVAEFRRLTVDLNKNGVRTKLQRMKQKIREGAQISDEELKAVGISDESEVDSALEKADKLHKVFISEWDLAEFMNKILNSGKFDDKLFVIRGVIECQWSDDKQEWYINMKPQRISLAKEDSEEQCVGSAILYFGANAVDDSSLEETEKYYITAYTFEYDSARSKVNGKSTNIPYEFKLVIPNKVPNASTGEHDENDEKRAKGIANKFIVNNEDEVYEYGIRFDILSGPQKREIKLEDLTDEQRDDLELGILTMDDIIADMGGNVYGKSVTENVYKSVMVSNNKDINYTRGRKETVYKPDDLIIPPLEMKKINSNDELDGLFDDEEDLFN